MLPHARIALFVTGFLSACAGSATTTTTTPESRADERGAVEAPQESSEELSEAGSTPAESPARGPGQCQISRIPAGGAGTLTRIAIGADGRWLERRTMEVPGGGALQLGYQWAGDVVSTTLAVDGGPPRTGTMTLRRGAREWIVEERWPDAPLVTWTWSLDAGGHATSMVAVSSGQTVARWSCPRDTEGRIVRAEAEGDEGVERWELVRDAQGRVIEIRWPETGHVTVIERTAGRITETSRDASGEMFSLTRYDGDCEDVVRPRCGWDPMHALPPDAVPR